MPRSRGDARQMATHAHQGIGAAGLFGLSRLPDPAIGVTDSYMPESTATLQDALETDRSRLHRGVVLRRTGTTVLVLLVLAALCGWFGLRSATKNASQGAVTTKLHYAQITRRGVDTPWDLDISHNNGFDDDVTVRLSLSYLDLLDQHAV